MKTLILALILSNLTGCAIYGKYADAMDTCQIKSRPAGAPMPSYCGAGAGTNVFVTRSNPGHYQVVVK